MAATLAIEDALTMLQKTRTDWHGGPELSPIEIFQKVGIDAWLEAERKYTNA